MAIIRRWLYEQGTVAAVRHDSTVVEVIKQSGCS